MTTYELIFVDFYVDIKLDFSLLKNHNYFVPNIIRLIAREITL